MAIFGTVKWFDRGMGYGFILSDVGDEGLFAHYTAIRMDGFRALAEGQRVSFDVKNGVNGRHAVNITPQRKP